MPSDDWGWLPLLGSKAPKDCRLKAALFTTYDRADERFVAEHLLPTLLKIEQEPEGNDSERQYFLLKLDQRLKELYGRIVVISSSALEEPQELDEGGSRTGLKINE